MDISNNFIKNILILCTGNSCRSIIAEAILKNYFKNTEIFSAGSNPKGEIHPHAKRILEQNELWDENLYSKSVEQFLNKQFDIVITVCDKAKETCPYFPNANKIIHIPFPDPEGKPYCKFVELYNKMKKIFTTHYFTEMY